MNKKYKFILLSNDSGERLQLNDSPIGWDAQKFNILRDLVYFGVFKNLSAEFQFVGDGYNFTQRHKLRYGVDADVLMRVYKKNKFLFEGKINYFNHKDDRKNQRFHIDIIQSAFIQNFQNRENIKLNILNRISLDRNAINAAQYKTATIRKKIIQFYTLFQGAMPGFEMQTYHHTWPFLMKENGNPDVNPEQGIQDGGNVPSDLYTAANAIYNNSLPEDQTLTIDWAIDYTSVYKGAPIGIAFPYPRVQVFNFLLMNDDNTVATVLFTRRFQDAYGSFSDSYSDTIVVGPGQYLIFTNERYIYQGGVDVGINSADMDGPYLTELTYELMFLQMKQNSELSDSTHPVFLPHELFTNLVAQITGKDNAVYSPFFGRVELGYDQDGEGAYLGVTKGELLRGVPLEQEFDGSPIPIKTKSIQVPTSMRDAWVSYNAVFNLGILIRGEQIIIEPKDNLLNHDIAINLGEVSELVTTPALDFLFNSVSAGYPRSEYEKENGRDEFNTTTQYTNSLKSVKKEFDLKSIYYGDGYGIEFARRARVYETGSSDSRYDELIFFIDLIKDGEELISRRLEGIDYVDGIFSAESALNLRISPGQNLLRWQKYLNIPLHRKQEKVYFFQSKEKNSSLHVATSLGSSIDREDLQFNQAAYFIPEERLFKTSITITQLFTLLENPLGVVKYTYKGESFYDYLSEVDSETEKGTSQWKMLGTKPTPVETESDATDENVLKYGDGPLDYIRYGDGENDIVLYQ